MMPKYGGLMNRIAFAAVLLAMAGMAFAGLPTVLIEKVDPQPVEPGKDITIDARFYNRETTDTGSFNVLLETKNNFVLKSSTENFTSLSLCSFCSKKNTYFLAANATAVSGVYPVYIKTYTGDVEARQQIDIKVQGKPSVIFSSSSGLENVLPKAQFTAVLDVTNVGSGQARQIKIQPDSASFTAIGSSIKTVDTLNAGEKKQAEFILVAASGLEANSYSIPFRISYLDEQGSTSNFSQNLGLRVINKGDIGIQTIKVAALSGSQVTANQPFAVVARLENTGTGNADGVSAELDCPFAARKKSFIGQLKRDEDAPAVFDMVSGKPGDFACGLTIAYKDDTGNRQLNEKINITVSQAGSIFFLPAAILVLALLFVFRKRLPFAGRKKQ